MSNILSRLIPSFPFAPITRAIDWFSTDDAWRYIRRHMPSGLGLAALAVAHSEIGKGEAGKNNSGADVERYRAGFGGNGPWCAAFIYFDIDEASSARKETNPIQRTHSARRLFGRVAKAGWLVNAQMVQPGDIVLWARGGKDSGKGHIGIVSQVEHDRDGRVLHWWYIAGNEGTFPALVQSHRGDKRKRRIGFARLP